jgi:muconate cycloisomerase
MSDLPAELDIFRTELPMRAFEHAAATRKTSEAIIVRLRTRSGRVGWGEALPRAYVTGETLETVVEDIERIFWPALRECRSEGDLHQAVMRLPCIDGDRVIAAARGAVELAAITAFGIPWYRECADRARSAAPRISGVLGSRDPAKTSRLLRRMRLYGLRHFKLKLGFDDGTDQANLRAVHRQLHRSLAARVCSLRVDVNSAWKYKEVTERIEDLTAYDVCAVEQPCDVRPHQMVDLAYRCRLPLIADESCLTEQDVRVLFGAEGRVWPNLRLAKNGGLGPVSRMARQAAVERVPFVLGCLVGESGILSVAQRAFLAAGATPWAVEGNYGIWLLRDDLMVPSPRFGYRGRLRLPRPGQFARPLRSDKLSRYARQIGRLG